MTTSTPARPQLVFGGDEMDGKDGGQPVCAPNPLSRKPCAIHALIDPNGPLAHLEEEEIDESIEFEGGEASRRRRSAQPSQDARLKYQPSRNLRQLSPSRSATPTSQLARTAVSVREAAKRIGRARVRWENPKTIMIITKARDNHLVKLTKDLALWLIHTPRYGVDHALTVYVDGKLEPSKRFNYAGMVARDPILKDKLRFWTPHLCATNPHLFDFVITLGGDGTVLFASWLFQTVVPPVMPFHLGSLGFLTAFNFAQHKHYLTTALNQGVRINLRMRFTCTVYRFKKESAKKGGLDGNKLYHTRRASGGYEIRDGSDASASKQRTKTASCPKSESEWEQVETDWMRNEIRRETGKGRDKADLDENIPCFTTVPEKCFEVLNDLVVDRGPSPFMSMLELFGDDQHLTTVQADGLTVATPTGSTAYSLSAGGALTHPEIAAFLITPICPHTLSFRPMLLPDSIDLRICVPFNSRSTAWVSFDGRGRLELNQGDHIKITASKYPFPTICRENTSRDWFTSLSRCLRWNERQRQKSFMVVESNEDDQGNPVFDRFSSSRRQSLDRDYTGPSSTSSFTESDSRSVISDRTDLSSNATQSTNLTDIGEDGRFLSKCPHLQVPTKMNELEALDPSVDPSNRRESTVSEIMLRSMARDDEERTKIREPQLRHPFDVSSDEESDGASDVHEEDEEDVSLPGWDETELCTGALK